MGNLKGIEVNTTTGGLGRRSASKDGICALIMCGIVTAGYDTLGEVVKLNSAQEAIDLGFTAAYDDTNEIQVFYHISEFFRMNPGGTLYVMLVAQTQTFQLMVSAHIDALVGSDIIQEDLASGIMIGLVRNPTDSYTPTITTGLNDEVIAAVPAAQTKIDALAAENKFIDCLFIEARDLAAPYASAKNWRAVGETAKNVAVVAVQDADQVAVDSVDFAKTAAVGLVMGIVAARKVEENAGAVRISNPPDIYKGQENMRIDNVGLGRMVNISISSGETVAELTTAEITALTDRGYIIAGTRQGYPGVYLSGDPTAIDSSSDFAQIRLNRVINKAKRKAIATLTPFIMSKVGINPSTGQIAALTIQDWKNALKSKVSEPMLTDEEVSGIEFEIDPSQNVLSTGNVAVRCSIVPYGSADSITFGIGFTNPFN